MAARSRVRFPSSGSCHRDPLWQPWGDAERNAEQECSWGPHWHQPCKRARAMNTTKSKRSAKAHGRSRRSKARSSSTRTRRRSTLKKWSKRVAETSDALDLEKSVFTRGARAIARSLKRSAEQSRRRKAGPYRSAMSMLSYYINRGGRNLSAARRRSLEQAKKELRSLFGMSNARAR